MSRNHYVSGSWNCIKKKCSRCGEERSLDCFYKQTSGKYGVTSRCKPCVLDSNREWRNKNKQRMNEYARQWQREHKDVCLQRTREWRKRNLAYDAYRSKLYNTRKRNQCPPWADLDKIREIYLNCPTGYHVDHIIPLKGILASGLHVETNLQYLPAKENMQKRNLYGWE